MTLHPVLRSPLLPPLRSVFERGVGHAAALPVNTLAPAIAGDPYIGETLTATPGTWTGADSVAGEWYVNNVATGDTDTSYTVLLADAGKPVEYRETATNTAGSVTQASNTISIGSLTVQVQALFTGGYDGTMLMVPPVPQVGATSMFREPRAQSSVTAVNQTVGLLLDCKHDFAVGPQLLSDPGFDSPGVWGGSPQWSVSGGKATHLGTGANYLAQSGLQPTRYKWYSYQVDVLRYDAGQVLILCCGNSDVQFIPTIGSLGTKACYLPSVSAPVLGHAVRGGASGGQIAEVDNFFVNELYGRHAYQGTESLKPKLSSDGKRIQFDGVNDTLNVLFPALGSNCTIGQVTTGGSPSILTGQTIAAGARTITTDFSRYFVINRALTTPETATLTAWLAEGAL